MFCSVHGTKNEWRRWSSFCFNFFMLICSKKNLVFCWLNSVFKLRLSHSTLNSLSFLLSFEHFSFVRNDLTIRCWFQDCHHESMQFRQELKLQSEWRQYFRTFSFHFISFCLILMSDVRWYCYVVMCCSGHSFNG
jgi:hypothetical protein